MGMLIGMLKHNDYLNIITNSSIYPKLYTILASFISMDPKVAEYIEKQISPQKELCLILRDIIITTFPSIKEEMKYGVPYYGNKFYIVALKTHVNLGFSIKGLTREEINLFEGTGKTTRHLKVRSKDDIDDIKIKKLLKMVNEKN